jgi:hypothetical protein
MQAFTTKLIEVTEFHAKTIAKQWFNDVRKNPKTPSYHNITEDRAIPQAIEFYSHFREVFMSDKPFEAAMRFFSKYAEDRYREGIPLNEAIYSLVMMRRHMWLYAEFQAVWTTAVDYQQSSAGLNRTILMFDYATYVITGKYQELIRHEVDLKVGALGIITSGGPVPAYKTAIMTALVFVAGLVTWYYHAVLNTDVIFTHLFYIPIALAAIWYRRKGVLVAVLLGVFILISHAIFLKSPLIDDLIRAVMFIVIAVIIATLTEGLCKIVTPFQKSQDLIDHLRNKAGQP